MAQIFGSHSQRDEEYINFFSKAFLGTNVRGCFEEFEKLINGTVTAEQVARDIEQSNAVFVILSQHVNAIPFTRDWVVLENGIAKNKDIWVFEPYREFGTINVITPFVKHYVLFDTIESHLAYLMQIVRSYDDSHVLPTVLAAAGLGALLMPKDRATASGVAAIAGLILSDRGDQRPIGMPTTCSACHSSYSVHLPMGSTVFRCPVCNQYLQLQMAFTAGTVR